MILRSFNCQIRPIELWIQFRPIHISIFEGGKRGSFWSSKIFGWSELEMCFFVDNCKLLFFLPKNVIIVMLKVPCCSKLNFCIVCNFMPKLLCSTYRKVVNSMRVKPRQALGKVIWVKSFTLCCPLIHNILQKYFRIRNRCSPLSKCSLWKIWQKEYT